MVLYLSTTGLAHTQIIIIIIIIVIIIIIGNIQSFRRLKALYHLKNIQTV